MSDLYKKRLNEAPYHSTYQPGDRVVLEVRFPQGGKTYCYDAPPGIYYPGDKVFVKVSEGYKDVTVYKAYYYESADYPFYTLPLKSIEGRADDTNYARTTRIKYKTAEKTHDTDSKNDNRKEENRTTETLSKLDNPVYKEGTSVKAGSYNSYRSSEKSKSRKYLIALIIIAIVGILQGPTWYRNYIDSKPLYNSDIVGTWKSEYGMQEVVFSSDHSAKVKGEDYLTGKWEIVSESQQTIRLHYIVTDSQLDQYNEEYYYDMDGYIATKEDVLEWEMEYADDLPPEGIYTFKRSNNRLICNDYYDYYLEKR